MVVTTHLNTTSVHNHLVVNSVSFRTGRKFENHISDHFRLREISDEICREHGLSVLENAPFYDSQRKAYWVHKAGKKAHRDLLREDVERCLKAADTPDEFFEGLEDLGYEVDYERRSVKAPTWERPIRLDRMGYTEQVIRRRTWNSYRSPTNAEDRENAPTRNYSSTSLLRLERQLEFTVVHTHSFGLAVLDLMFLLMIQLLQLTREPEAEWERRKPMSPEFRMELERLDEYSKMSELLARYEIHTGEELLHFEAVVTERLKDLKQERQGVRNQLRRCRDPEQEADLKAQAKEVTQRMKPLRELLKTAGKIQERAPKVEKLLLQEKAMELEAQQRNRNKNRSYDYER